MISFGNKLPKKDCLDANALDYRVGHDYGQQNNSIDLDALSNLVLRKVQSVYVSDYFARRHEPKTHIQEGKESIPNIAS